MGTRGLRIPNVVLAWVWALWVGFTATPLPHRCEMSASPVPDEAGHHGDHHGQSAPGPLSECHCVGHACSATAATSSAAPALRAIVTLAQVGGPAILHDRLAEAPAHLLPFSLGPPALPSA